MESSQQSRVSRANIRSRLTKIVDEFAKNKERYGANDLINTFKDLIAAVGTYNQPMCVGKKPQQLYNSISSHMTFSEDDQMSKMINLLMYTPPDEDYIDIAATVVQVLEMTRHDLFLNFIMNHIKDLGYKVLSVESPLSDYFGTTKRLTPDILVENDGMVAVEVKMRDPLYLDMKQFYDKYKISDDLDVVVLNYSKGVVTHYGDRAEPFANIIMTNDEMVWLDNFINNSRKIKDNYSKFELFRLIDRDDNDIFESDFIDGYKEATLELKEFKEISSLYGEHMDEILSAIKSFNLDSPHCRDTLENAYTDLYSHVRTNVVHQVFQNYKTMVNNDEYKRFPEVNMNVSAYVDSVNLDRYEITDKRGPSLYIPFISCQKVGVSRIEYYKHVFGNIDLNGKSDYTLAALQMLSNVMTNDNLDKLLHSERLSSYTVQYAHEMSGTGLAEKKVKLLVKDTLQHYDLNIYINNTFSYTDLKMKRSKFEIGGFERKNYNRGEVFKKESLLLEDVALDVKSVKDYLSRYESYYTKESIIEDLRCYKSDFNDYQDINESLIDSFAYYSYYSSKLYKTLIALSCINNKKYRLVQCYDPNTICIMLPNGSLNDKKPLKYFTVSITRNYDDVRLNKIMGIYHDHVFSNDNIIILSKVISLDVNRCKLLSNSFAKYMILTSYYNTFVGYESLKKDINFHNLLYTNMVTLQTLETTENFKNILMVCYSDYGNPEELIRDKFSPRIKNYTCGQLVLRMSEAILESKDQRKKILKSQNDVELTKDGYDITNTGFRLTDDLVMPISRVNTSNPREILQEAYLIFYLGNKTLHGSSQELIELYSVPYKFEQEYTEYLKNNPSVVMEISQDDDYGFSFESMKRTTIQAYSKTMNNKSRMRDNIKEDLDLNSSILSKPQFSSTKSMVTSDSPIESVDLTQTTNKHQFKLWLLSVPITNVEEFVTKSNKRIREINTSKSQASKDKPYLLPYLSVKYLPNGKHVIEALPDKIYRYSFDNFKDSSNNKVFDEFLNLTKDKAVTVRSSLEDMKSNMINNHFRIFNKDQRTFTDREIYTGNKEARLCLYPIEKLFLSINRCIPEEAITISGDNKHRKMLDQRYSILKEGRFKLIDGTKRTILAISSDASKWSARDSYIKFLIPIAYNPYLTENEKWFYIYFFSRYYYKDIILTEKVLADLVHLASDKKEGVYEGMTNNYSQNYFTVRSNWLQGNLNRISSFVHYCSSIMVETALHVFNDHYGDSNLMRFMVHSDDSSYDFSIAVNTKNDQNLSMRTDYGRYLIAIIQTCERHHSIILNKKKTYISTFYKEFLSTLLVGNVLSYFYIADLLPIASDLAYKSPIEDMASLTSFIQNAYAHSAPYSVIKSAINVINYVSLSTYNLNNTSSKSPINHYKYESEGVDGTEYKMLPISILPTYRFGIESAGLLPYYCSDAYYIFQKIMGTVDYDESKPMEMQLTIDNVRDFILNETESYLNYIKMCMFSYDSTIFLEELDDPYSCVSRDLANSAVISVGTNRKKMKDLRYKSYNEFKSRESEILMKYISHPEWLVAKPKDFDDVRDNVLSNYLMPNFIESLMYSTPARDFGNRVMHANSKMYRLNVKGYTNDTYLSINELYDRLDSIVKSTTIDPAQLLSYIQTFLFSDKEVSYSVQVLMMKREVLRKPKLNIDLKVTQPQSLYTRERGHLSVTSMIVKLLSESTKITNVDSKFASIIEYADNLLNYFDLTGVKMYDCQADIDENYMVYAKLIHPTSYSYETIITELDACDDNEYRSKVLNIRKKYKSILIQYVNDMKEFKETSKFNFGNYPTPTSIISTIDKYSKKDIISTKVYMSTKKTDKRDDYWLTRLGYYQDEFMFVKYDLSSKYRLSKDDQLTKLDTDRDKMNSFVQFLNFVIKDDLIDDYSKLTVSGLSYDEIVRKLLISNNLNHKLVLHKLHLLSDSGLSYSLDNEARVMNYWIIPTNSMEDKSVSSVIYFHRGVFLAVATQTMYGKLSLSLRFFAKGSVSTDVRNRLISNFSKDYRIKLTNQLILSGSKNRKNQLYRDSMGNISINPVNRHREENQLFCNYDVIQYQRLELESVDINENNRYIYTIKATSSNHNLLTFQFKDNLTYNSEDLLSICLSNLSYYPSLINIIVQNRLITEYNTFDVISRLNDNQLYLFATTNYGRTISIPPSFSNSVNDIHLRMLKHNLETNFDDYETNMRQTYGRYGTTFLDYLKNLLESYEPINGPVIDIFKSASLARDYARLIESSYDLPFNKVFHNHLSRPKSVDHPKRVVIMILIFIIKKAILGTEFYEQLYNEKNNSDSDSDY